MSDISEDSNLNSKLELSSKELKKDAIAAEWRIPIKGKLYKIEFEHGTASGKRVLWIDDEVTWERSLTCKIANLRIIFYDRKSYLSSISKHFEGNIRNLLCLIRRPFPGYTFSIFADFVMFKLVGDDIFSLDDTKCVITVDPLPGFKYKYSLLVNGKSYEQFKENQAKALRTWETVVNDEFFRIVLEKNTLDIFLNGKIVEENGEFVDGGTDTKFCEDGINFILSARTSGNKREGLLHTLTVNGMDVSELLE